MKNCFVVSFCLCLVSCISQEDEKNRLNMAATRLAVMDVRPERIYDLNDALVSENDSLTITEETHFFKVFDDTLQLIKDELISASGGYTEQGEYMNLPAINYVNAYFYEETHFRDNSHKFFFQSLNLFLGDLKKANEESQFKERFDKKIMVLKDHYGLTEKELLFRGLSLSEAVELLESIRKDVAIEQTEYLIKTKRAS